MVAVRNIQRHCFVLQAIHHLDTWGTARPSIEVGNFKKEQIVRKLHDINLLHDKTNEANTQDYFSAAHTLDVIDEFFF